MACSNLPAMASEAGFTVFPAIDLRQGRCVRLQQGDPKAETLYSDDPAAVAREWVAQGAEWLHVVNLDGAFGDQNAEVQLLPEVELLTALPLNLQRLSAIRAAVGAIPIQFGGGLRYLEDIALALGLGATRVVLGTAAAAQPQMLAAALDRFGSERIVAGIDARDGRVATHGWTQTSDLTAADLAQALAAAGVRRAVYTDISRDGMLSGVNVAATAHLARQSGLRVIASGGVRGIEDIDALLAHAGDGIEGVIAGQALYRGALNLRIALVRAHAMHPTHDLRPS